MGKKSKDRKMEKKESRNKTGLFNSKRLLVVIVIAAVLTLGGYFIYSKGDSTSDTLARISDIQKTATATAATLRGGEERPTLSPALFVGKVAAAYKIARENRELLDSMYCYCHCKENFGHKSLLSCYVDNHAANCGICMEQAFYSYSLHKKGLDITQVREAVDKEFWRPLR